MNVTGIRFASFALSSCLLVAAPVWAHDNATLDSRTTPHGGQLRMSGPYHFELVMRREATGRDKPIEVYLTDHGDQPVSSDGVKGVVNIESGGKQLKVLLDSSGPNMVAGKGDYAPSVKLKAVVSLTFHNGEVWTAAFTPFAPRASTSADPNAAHDH